MAKKISDPFSAHEAMDRTHLLATTFGDFVADHPFIQADAKLKKQAEAIAEAMGEFYQSVGQAAFAVHHVDGRPEALAKELGISAKSLRHFLRKEFPRSAALRNAPWHLSNEQLAAVRQRWLRRPVTKG